MLIKPQVCWFLGVFFPLYLDLFTVRSVYFSCSDSVLSSGFLHSGLAVHGGSLRRKRGVPAAVGWWAASVVATVTGDHARRSQGSQQTAAKSLCSAVPADSGWRKPRQWYRPQKQVRTLVWSF